MENNCEFLESCATGTVRERRAQILIIAKDNLDKLDEKEKKIIVPLLEKFKPAEIHYISEICQKNQDNAQGCEHFYLTSVIIDKKSKKKIAEISGPRNEMYLKN